MVEDRPYLVIAALREELAPLVSALEGKRWLGPARRGGVEGRLDGVPVRMLWTGEGPRRASRGIEIALDREIRQPILVLGVAGGLTAALEVGDVLVAREIVDEEGQLSISGAAIATALRWGECREGTVLSVDRIVGDDRSRQELAASAPQGTPACVDMESAAFVRTARARGQDCLVVRVMSDTVGDELPDYLERCRRPDGSIDRRRVALAAMLRPQTIPALLALSRRVSSCAGKLGRFGRWWLGTVSTEPLWTAGGEGR